MSFSEAPYFKLRQKDNMEEYMGRREMREHIFKLLFLNEFNGSEEMPQQIQLYFDGLEDLSPMEQTYMENKYAKITEKLEELDSILNEKSAGWKTKRMSKVDLNILRLAVYDVPVKVAINEAVEISKSFGGEDSASFVNGILGKIARESL